MTGTLWLVGTPIGNLEDLTDRARRVLGEVDVIACEDPSRTRQLLSHIGIPAPQILTLNEGNERERVGQVTGLLGAGSQVALVSDAGMPSFSDPGYRLVAACVAAGLEVDVAPGPAAAVTALVLSGLPTDRFVFEGFLPRKTGARRAHLDGLAGEPRTIVLFESPRRLATTLAEAADALGADRRAAVCRELTKVHQEVARGTLGELAKRYADEEPRGEISLVIEGASESEPDLRAATRRVRELVGEGSSRRDAAAQAAAETGASRRALYEASLRTDLDEPG